MRRHLVALWHRSSELVATGTTAWSRLIHRYGWLRVVTAASMAVLICLVLVGGILRVRVDTGPESLLPANDPTLAAVEQKARDFGGDPVIVLLRYTQPREFVRDTGQTNSLLRLEGALARLPDVATVYGPATVLNQLAGAAQNFLAEIGVMRNTARSEATTAAQNAGKSPDDVAAAGQAAVDIVNYRYAPLIVKGLPVGLPTLKNPRFAEAVIFGSDGLAKPAWQFIVPGTDTVVLLVRPRQDMDQASTHRLVEAVRTVVRDAQLDVRSVTVSGVPTVSSELADEVTQEAPLIGALVALALLLRYLLVPAPGSRLQRMRPLIASLLGSAATVAIIGWLNYPLSIGAVLLLPLLVGVGSSFPLYLAAVPNLCRVIVMSLASAAAFLALVLSPLPFVSDLGFALAVGILLTIGISLLMNRFWPPPTMVTAGPVAPVTRRRPVWQRVGVLIVVGGAAVLGWAVLPRITVSADPEDLARGLPALTDAKTVESTLGASGEIGVRLTGPDTLSPSSLRWATDAQNVLAARFSGQMRPVIGIPTFFSFLGPEPTEAQIQSAYKFMPSYLSSSVVRPDRQVGLLVYGIKLQDLGAQRLLLDEVMDALPPPPAGYSVDTVGLPVAAARGYELLLGGRYLANLGGIAVAGLVLLLGLRPRWDAVRAVAAAMLATGWGLTLLWLLGIPFSPLTVALGSLVSVTGCEFVVLLTEARRRTHNWLWRSVAIACVTSVLGYLALAPSRLWLVREFGLVLSAAVVLSYAAAKLVMWIAPVLERGSEQEPVRPVMEVMA